MMEQKLQTTLKDNEKVLWFGRPTKSKLFQSPDRISQYVAWGVMILMTILAFGVFLPYALSVGKSTGIILIGLVPMLFVPLAVAIRPYLDKKILEQNTIYAITDQRIIAVVKDNVMTMSRAQPLNNTIESRDGNSGNICFNAAIGKPEKNSRANAVLGFKRGNDSVAGLLFFHVSNPDEIVKALA